ncbi:DUF1638 domain-containing protein [Methanolobus halotolerans]|uniref:DUF1638 domain-containing protein n=1 Tax=Methanolobus halotolerans TaxID=2052935 RepID=A0A4E0QZ98_9EURY|nr:DUF1638 domain-containing protein [Methanolobus halotolerans]TGC09094.1 hypothetical protein CUN85_06890 [Methanolobus halotolerans]
MPSLYVISCRMFEDELVHIFEEEDKDARVILIENENIEGIEKKFSEVGIKYEKTSVEDLPLKLGPKEDFIVVLNILEFALDANPSLLKDKVYTSIEETGKYFNGILVFYGLCGNVLGSLEKDFSYMDIPVRILKDACGNIVDDCICASFDNRDAYVNAVMGETRGEGTYFLTPMQAANWREMLVLAKLAPDPDDTEMMKMVFDYSGYKNVGKVDTGLSYEKDFGSIVDEFASLFDFEKRLFSGSTKISDECYHSIKKYIVENVTAESSVEGEACKN